MRGRDRDEVVLVDPPPLSLPLSGLGSGGNGRFSRRASDCVPALGNTGGGVLESEGLLALNCEKMTGEIGERPSLSGLRGVDGVDEERGMGGTYDSRDRSYTSFRPNVMGLIGVSSSLSA